MTEGFLTQEIFAALRDALAQTGDLGGPTAFAAVEGRLSSPAQALLHQVIAADDMGDEASCWEQAQACLRQLENNMKKRQVDDLRARVKTAEREGRMQEAFEWMAQLHRLERAK